MPAESTTSSESTPRATENRSTTPVSTTFAEYISSRWAERVSVPQPLRTAAARASERRAIISSMHRGERLVIPAGGAAVRSNDTDYPFRAHSAFAYLTGWGSDSVPGSVLVLTPDAGGHTATLYFRKAAGRNSDEFYANSDIGEFWTGVRPSLDEVSAELGLATADLAELSELIENFEGATVIVREADRELTDQLDGRQIGRAHV